jgi:hypothetical protein
MKIKYKEIMGKFSFMKALLSMVLWNDFSFINSESMHLKINTFTDLYFVGAGHIKVFLTHNTSSAYTF